ncbi:MAG: hypothetical protein CM15mV25_1290 [uncultured marine virus]|nr:MAG: hypothetical protein CM15mV25_1290 [uncultured marine virus]
MLIILNRIYKEQLKKGTNYIVLEDNNNNLHKAWIWDCILIGSDKEVAVREHNLNVDYEN